MWRTDKNVFKLYNLINNHQNKMKELGAPAKTNKKRGRSLKQTSRSLYDTGHSPPPMIQDLSPTTKTLH